MYAVLKVYAFNAYLRKAQWLSWLERRPVTAEVESSSLFWVVDMEYLADVFFVRYEVS